MNKLVLAEIADNLTGTVVEAFGSTNEDFNNLWDQVRPECGDNINPFTIMRIAATKTQNANLLLAMAYALGEAIGTGKFSQVRDEIQATRHHH